MKNLNNNDVTKLTMMNMVNDIVKGATEPTDVVRIPHDSTVYIKKGITDASKLEAIHEFDWWNEIEGFVHYMNENKIHIVDEAGVHYNKEVASGPGYILDIDKCILYKL